MLKRWVRKVFNWVARKKVDVPATVVREIAASRTVADDYMEGQASSVSNKNPKNGNGKAAHDSTMAGQLWQEELLEEIDLAKQQWRQAEHFFQLARGADQVDYAIFALTTAERRYDMLLRMAKKADCQWPRRLGS